MYVGGLFNNVAVIYIVTRLSKPALAGNLKKAKVMLGFGVVQGYKGKLQKNNGLSVLLVLSLPTADAESLFTRAKGNNRKASTQTSASLGPDISLLMLTIYSFCLNNVSSLRCLWKIKKYIQSLIP